MCHSAYTIQQFPIGRFTSMSTKTTQDTLYSIYVEQSAITLYLDNGLDYRPGQFISSQADYQMAYEIGLQLASQKGLTLINQVLEAQN